jgi:hypothetical protein
MIAGEQSAAQNGGSARGYQDLCEELAARYPQFPAPSGAYLYIIMPAVDILNCRVECVRRKLRARSLRLGWHHRSK